MKKIIALVLCLLMAVSLAACGGQAATGESGTNNKQNETTPAAEETKQPEESSEPVETEPAFDTSWAGADYIMPIPEPPFAYEVNVDGAAVEIRSTNGGMNGDVTHQSILDYCEELKNAGFTLNLTENEIGERYGRTCYEFSASDAAGNNVNLIDDGGEVFIYVSLTKTSGETEPAFDTSWASNDFEKLIPQPPFNGWNGEKASENVYKMETSQANADGNGTYYDTWAAYIQTLKDCGFTVKGDTYSSEGTDSNDNKVELQCGDGHAWITIYTAMTDHTATTLTGSESISSSDNREEVLEIPELPEGDWQREETNEDSSYVMTIDEISKADIDKYIDVLISEGFDVSADTQHTDAGEFYLWCAQKEIDGTCLDITVEYGIFGGSRCYITVAAYD